MRAVLTVLLSPILLAQALWVVCRASVLPEASGPRSGTSGTGAELRLLILGDSSGAGVGVESQDEALAGQLVSQLSGRFRVHWQVVAQSGATTASALKMLDDLSGQSFDCVVVALGVNDTKNAVPARTWRNNYHRLIQRLINQHGAQIICASGLPPMGRMPILPRPLRDVLGARAARFDAILGQVLSDYPECRHIPMDFDMDVSAAARDGFHPGPAIYTEWARRIATQIPGDL